MLKQTDYAKRLETDGTSILKNLEWPIIGSVKIGKFRSQAAASLVCLDKISALDTSTLYAYKLGKLTTKHAVQLEKAYEARALGVCSRTTGVHALTV